MAELLLEKGAYVDAQGDSGCSALMTATREGHKEICELLLRIGVTIDLQENLEGLH